MKKAIIWNKGFVWYALINGGISVRYSKEEIIKLAERKGITEIEYSEELSKVII